LRKIKREKNISGLAKFASSIWVNLAALLIILMLWVYFRNDIYLMVSNKDGKF
jgi:hypothetical protein